MGAAMEPGTRCRCFQHGSSEGGVDAEQARQYDVTRDGRFLINTVLDDAAATSITLIQHCGGEALVMDIRPSPLDQLSILKLVTAGLDTAGIRYMITGSIAAGHYAQPRMTRDIDLVVELDAADAERLVALFGDQFECDLHTIRAAIARRSLFNLIHTDAIVKVDFIVRKSTPYRLEESMSSYGPTRWM